MKSLLAYIKNILSIPKESGTVEIWKVLALWILRVFIFYVAVTTIFSGDWKMGLITLIAATAIISPSIYTRGRIKDFPIEIEIMLFIIVFIQYVLGEIADLYYQVPYFDKFVHLTVPFLIASISYMLIFTMQKSEKLKATRLAIFLLTVLITMGIGGIWEVIEYGIDLLRMNFFKNWTQFQGSLVEDPYYDTMNDLLADFLGGILGALYAIKFIFPDINNARTKELIKDIEDEFLG